MSRQPKPWFRKDRNCWQVTIDGKRHNLGSDKKAAFAQFHELMLRPKETFQPASNLLVVSLADDYLEWLLNNRAKPTYEWYRYRIELFLQLYPTLAVADLKPFHVQRWVDKYPKLAKTSKRNYFRSVKRCIEWGLQQGYVDSNPLKHMEVPGAERREVSLNAVDFDEMIAALPSPEMQQLCRIAFQLGCRPQELLRVEARHFDEKHCRWIFPRNEAKGKRNPRIVYLTPEALKVTRQLCKRYPQGKIFRNTKGKPWTVTAVNSAFKRLQTRMGKAAMKQKGIDLPDAIKEEMRKDPSYAAKTIKQLTPGERRKLTIRACAQHAPKYCLYALRHAWATRALESEVDSLTVATLMGHSDPSMLARVYSHIANNPEHMSNQMKRALGES